MVAAATTSSPRVSPQRENARFDVTITVPVSYLEAMSWKNNAAEAALPAEAAAAIFQVVSQRYLKTSIVLTSNRGVGAWGEIRGDTTVAAAMLDRLLHRSVVLNLDGDSYRFRAHHAANDTLRRTTTGTRQPLT